VGKPETLGGWKPQYREGIYTAIYNHFPKECQVMGLTSSGPIEPKWKNDIQCGLRDAQDQGLVKHIGSPKSGEWQRL
jgi:hypothetical protein